MRIRLRISSVSEKVVLPTCNLFGIYLYWVDNRRTNGCSDNVGVGEDKEYFSGKKRQ